MPECVVCNLCDQPGRLESNTPTLRVACHARKFSQNEFTVWRCENCRSLHSKEEVDLPMYYEHYPLKNHKLDLHARVGYRNRIRMLSDLGLRKDHSILDFGCGQGLFVDFLKSKGYAKANGWDPFVPRFSKDEHLEVQYDVVTSYDVIEHVEDPCSYLITLLQYLKPGGILVLGTPCADDLELDPKKREAIHFSQPYHRHILSERVLCDLAKKNDLSVLHVYRRSYFDSLVPLVNTRFMWEYIHRKGGFIDVVTEPIDWSLILRTPPLWLYAFLGYFMPTGGDIIFYLRKRLTKKETPVALAA